MKKSRRQVKEEDEKLRRQDKDDTCMSLKAKSPEEIKKSLDKKFPGKLKETKVINGELAIWIEAGDLIEICRFLKESELDLKHPRSIAGVDRKEYLEVVYHLCSINNGNKITVKVKLPKDSAELPSLYNVYKGSEWHERETGEMFGITFDGHPDPRHLLLLDNFQGYPLRKDFKKNNEVGMMNDEIIKNH
ncbi:MAG: NADH-quinone oxidoreductase subunit C [bacterium]